MQRSSSYRDILFRLSVLLIGATATHGDGSCSGSSGNPIAGHDQKGGDVLHGIGPNFDTQPTPTACCLACVAYGGCNTYVWQPSTRHCWFVKGSKQVVEKEDRVVGWTVPAPTPPAPPTPPTPARVTITQWNQDTLRVEADLPGRARPKGKPPGALVANTLANPTSISSTGTGTGGVQTIANGNLEALLYSNGKFSSSQGLKSHVDVH